MTEDGLARAVDQAAAAVIVTDKEGIIEYANPAAARMTGYEIPELLGNTPRLFRSGMQDSAFYATLWATIKSGNVWRGEVINRRKNGSLYTGQMTISPLLNSAAETIGYIAIQEDITESGEALEAQQFLASIVESSPDAIVSSTLDGNVITWNRAAQILYGYSPGEIIGKPVALLVAPEEWPKLREARERLDRGERLPHFEGVGIARSGARIHISLSLAAATDSHGRPAGHCAIIRDITAAKNAERALRESEEHYRRLFERNLAGVVHTTLDGRILDCNPAFARSLGFDAAEQLRGHSIGNFYFDPDEAQRMLNRLRSERSASNVEILFRRNDGAPVWMLENLMRIEGPGGNQAIEATTFDISARKRFEQDLIEARERAQAGSRAKSEFLANMSHELRTPLNGIIAALDLLSVGETNREKGEYVDLAKQSAESLLGTIQQILDWVSLENQRIELQPRPFYITEIQNALESLSSAAKEKDLEFDWQINPRIPRILVGDPLRLRQVIANLVGNAIKFTERGRVSVALTRLSREADGVEIECLISDTGIGVSEEKKRTIFEAFSQADTSITRRYGGLGLGLPFAARLVKMMGGKIRLESKPGYGTEVRFSAQFGLPTGTVASPARSGEALSVPRNWDSFQRHIEEGRCLPAAIAPTTGVQPPIDARIWSAGKGIVRAVTRTPIDSGADVELVFDESHRASGEVISCQLWPNDYNLVIQLSSNGRPQREPRFPVSLAGLLTVLGEAGPCASPIEVIDVSGSGLGILCGERLRIGCCAQIKTDAGIILGEVRYSDRIAGDKVRCGIRIYQLIEADAPGVRPRRPGLWTRLRRTRHSDRERPLGAPPATSEGQAVIDHPRAPEQPGPDA